MALTRLNYQPGQYEACTDETLLPSSPVLNTWYNFEIGNWKHAISDIVLKQGGAAIPESAYELATDTKYTAREAGESDKTVYTKWRIVDGDYDEIATTVSGNNFGAYVDNEKLDTRLSALEALDAEDIPYDNSASDLTASDVQAAIDEVVTNTTASLAFGFGALTSDQTDVTTAATITFTGTDFSSGQYTIATTGQYLILAHVDILGSISGSIMTCKLKQGSTVLASAEKHVTAGCKDSLPLFYFGTLTASDVITVTAERAGAGTISIEGQASGNFTYIYIIKVR